MEDEDGDEHDEMKWTALVAFCIYISREGVIKFEEVSNW